MRWTVVLTILMTTNNIADTTDDQPFKYTNYPASTVNFHDIYTNTLALLADEPSTDFHSNMPTQFVEFQLPAKTETSTAEKSPPVEETTEAITTTTEATTAATTTKVVQRQTMEGATKNMQRGVLDLLLPAYRVKSFKNVFDMFRKVLSSTF